MSVNISEYKQSILDIFHELTEIEIKAHVDTIKSDPENYIEIGTTSIMIINRCRKILQTILKDKVS